jgi:hypothetical protein
MKVGNIKIMKIVDNLHDLRLNNVPTCFVERLDETVRPVVLSVEDPKIAPLTSPSMKSPSRSERSQSGSNMCSQFRSVVLEVPFFNIKEKWVWMKLSCHHGS